MPHWHQCTCVPGRSSSVCQGVAWQCTKFRRLPCSRHRRNHEQIERCALDTTFHAVLEQHAPHLQLVTNLDEVRKGPYATILVTWVPVQTSAASKLVTSYHFCFTKLCMSCTLPSFKAALVRASIRCIPLYSCLRNTLILRAPTSCNPCLAA